MADSFNREEFVAGYLAEAEEHLQSSGSALLRIEVALSKGEPQPRLVRELFRSLHTLKGLSAMVGIEPVVAIAHEMETLLRIADRGATTLSMPAVELLLSGVKAIEQRVRAFAKRELVPPPPPALLDALSKLSPSKGAEAQSSLRLLLPADLENKLSLSERDQLAHGIGQGRRAVRIDFTPTPDRAARGLNITSVRERVGKLAEIVKVVPGSVPRSQDSPGGLIFSLLVLTASSDALLAEAADAALPSLLTIRAEAQQDDAELDPTELPGFDEVVHSDSIRVSVTRLDDALESLSALVVSRMRLTRAVARLREQGADVRELSQLLQEHGREIRSLRGTLTRARMVSVAQLLERVPLLVRGMSKSAGKQVRLQLDTGRAELDKGVAERIFPALVHLIRNAIDHGIEPPDERKRLGKPAEGLVAVRCFERSSSTLELCIADDGSGVNAERVAKRAGQPIPRDDRGLLALITRPGLSTRDVADDRSGRGMGMDIVKRIIVDTLGGELSLVNQPGIGSTFMMRVPLSVSILDSLSFECGRQTYVVPMANVEEIVELREASVMHSPSPKKRAAAIAMLRKGDDNIPLVQLTHLFQGEAVEPTSALVVRRDEQRFAFAVDKMLGQQEVVIRPLEDPLVAAQGIAGTTDLGDGKPTLVLDLQGLTSMLNANREGARP